MVYGRCYKYFLYNQFSPTFQLQFITPNHYNDIIEERAIVKLCGYPICGKQLLNVSLVTERETMGQSD